jgi:hypothetical protein
MTPAARVGDRGLRGVKAVPQTSTQELSLAPMHGSLITYAMPLLGVSRIST